MGTPRLSKWGARLFEWEFWPFWLFYIPAFLYYAFLVIRERSLVFFTAANPGIEFGGMMGESKNDIYEIIPDRYLPKTVFVPAHSDEWKEGMGLLPFPFIAKPNMGERGRGVELIHNPDEMAAYASSMPVDYLIQEKVDYPIELGIFYVRFPHEETGRITSIVQKDFLTVKGDGSSTVKQLLSQNIRASIQIDLSDKRFDRVRDTIPAEGEMCVVEPIGNHCRGTTFLDTTEAYKEQLQEGIDKLAREIDGFHFGRFDLRCQSIEGLSRLENFKILELNGAGSEPGHIYQPGFSLWKAYGTVLWHLKVLADISRENKRRGIPYWTFRRSLNKVKEVRSHNRQLKNL